MNERLLKEIYRYDSKEKIYHVDIDLDTYRDVYSEWDYSPLVNRDLDEDLLEYLIDCSIEISSSRQMVIHFFLPVEIFNKKREERSIEGFRHYFSYRIKHLNSKRIQLFSNTLFLGVIGAIFLIVAYLVDYWMKENVASKLLSEGLIIGAWVAIWEIFTVLFFQVKELNLKIKHYKRLFGVELIYHYQNKNK